MSFQDSLQAVRRRLFVVVVGFVVGAVGGWLTAPGTTRRPTTFSATHTAFYEAGGGSYNIQQVALLASSGEVPSRVAAKLQLDRAQVRAAVSASAKADVGTISITARAGAADAAVALAELTAAELEAEVGGRGRAGYDADVARLMGTVEVARNRLNAVPPKDAAGQAAAQVELAAAQEALQRYQAAGPPKSGLRTLEAATASAASPAGVRVPASKPVRAGLLGSLGLLAGLGGAIALSRVDSRIRSKSTAEEVFGVPVVAEVPRLSKASECELLARTQPSSPFVEAYRGLRTYVALWAPENDPEDGHRVIVVTSPSAGEGKTTSVAHLAAMLAEIGRSVVVISADLRRPRLHQYFDMPIRPGLAEALNSASARPVFAGLDQPTSVRGVRLVPSGAPVENPAPLFEHAGDLVGAVRGLADFVLIDAPPLLVANDAVEMARYADGVLMVARGGETHIEAAERSAETLDRLEIPVIGVVLVASEAASSASRYYASRYYAEPERGGWLRRRAAADNEKQAPSGMAPVPQPSADEASELSA
ncbi:MAG TPA: CpsD/CapB family tyrosine-protein kinase [Acidimicrobiia bacterium]|nr:CpsD/CapB family tyrosine-protein kinase [Acidimicrobiia bacterium]